MALAGVGDGGRAGSEQSLELVGSQRLDRCEARQQQRGDGDQAATAGNRIDKTRHEGRCEQQQCERQRQVFHGQACLAGSWMRERGATYCMPGGYGQSTGVRYFFERGGITRA
jgi:hypothetical protein